MIPRDVGSFQCSQEMNISVMRDLRVRLIITTPIATVGFKKGPDLSYSKLPLQTIVW